MHFFLFSLKVLPKIETLFDTLKKSLISLGWLKNVYDKIMFVCHDLFFDNMSEYCVQTDIIWELGEK